VKKAQCLRRKVSGAPFKTCFYSSRPGTPQARLPASDVLESSPTALLSCPRGVDPSLF